MSILELNTTARDLMSVRAMIRELEDNTMNNDSLKEAIVRMLDSMDNRKLRLVYHFVLHLSK